MFHFATSECESNFIQILEIKPLILPLVLEISDASIRVK